MNAPFEPGATGAPDHDDTPLDLPDSWLQLSEPDLGEVESELVAMRCATRVCRAARWWRSSSSALRRRSAAATRSRWPAARLAPGFTLRALGIGPGDEVIASPYGWHQVMHTMTLAGARLVFSDIDYWTGCLDANRAAAQVTPATKAILAGNVNVNGHPAAWTPLRALARQCGATLIEDSTAALGLAQLARLPEILERRKAVEALYLDVPRALYHRRLPKADVSTVFWTSWSTCSRPTARR